MGDNKEHLFDVVRKLSDCQNTKMIRSVLAFWGFSGGAPYQRTLGSLSMGECSQLQLAAIMLKEPNLLILDEPTGSLSMTMKERLVQALQNYTGTLLVVSHEKEILELLDIDLVLDLPDGNYEEL